MQSWLTEALKVLGFTTPFVYAAATYGFFHWLDKKASGAAKKAVSEWVRTREYDKVAVAKATLEIFDRVYTRPLFGWRAFVRSAAITICITIFLSYEFLSPWKLEYLAGVFSFPFFPTSTDWIHLLIFLLIISNVLSDYISLFIVRGCMTLGREKPALAILLGPLLGMLIIVSIFYVRDLTWSTTGSLGYATISSEGAFVDMVSTDPSFDGEWGIFSYAALAVHAWLPFFLLCILCLKMLNYVRLGVDRAQRFIRHGRYHPFDAVGMIAAIIVFVVVSALHFAF
jgi:hypothetical protein